MELNKIKDILANQLNMDENELDAINEETALKDIKMDSLDLVEIIMAVEDTFGITIDSEQEENIHTVGDLIALVKNN
ncbi:MAG: acyl carrier protein [Clostridia bacterium]|nr:acyl carrier protein [Clostridia bacterium]